MKTFVFTLSAILLLSAALSAQRTEQLRVKGVEYADFLADNRYRYADYTRADIFFKNGDTGRARINFNNFSRQIKYIGENGADMVITNPHDIMFLSTGTDTIFCDNGYYEWFASSGIARMASVTTYKVVGRALIGAFGTSSPAVGVTGIGAILGENSYTFLPPNEELTIAKTTTWYISLVKGNKINFVPVTKENLSRLFPKKDTENYIRENKINLNKIEDLVDLLIFLSKAK